MSGNDQPDTPPEVPEEFAAAYRDAYLRALAEDQQGQEEPGATAPDPIDVPAEVGPVFVETPAGSGVREAWWFRPALIALLAAVLVLGAFGIGRLLADDDSDQSAGPSVTKTQNATPVPRRSRTPKPTPSSEPTRTSHAGPGWDGSVTPVTIAKVSVGCTSKPGVDSAGRPVRYVAGNTIDGDPGTAWRCDGRAIGQVLTLTLPAGTQVAEVGLIPGYAKTDPVSGADRYAENNRITRVRWTLADGVVIEQHLTGDPTDRAIQAIRVPRTASGTITLEILAVARGARNTTAISEIEVAAAAP